MITRLIVILSLLAVVDAKFSLKFRWKKDAGHPVVLVPGFGGSQLQANLTGKPSTVHYLCSTKTKDFYDLWLDIKSITGWEVLDCWLDNMRLVFNETTRESGNMEGVNIRVPGFGDTETVEWLDSNEIWVSAYFNTIVENLVSWGYKRGKNVVGAPFDWRKAPNELHDYYLILKSTIETTYRYNNNKKVVILGHSMGNPVMLYFYSNYVDTNWKSKYIESHVSLAAPWGGSMSIVQLYASGYNLHFSEFLMNSFKMRPMERSFSSSAYLFPSPDVWSKDDVLAITEDKNYTLANIEEYFIDMGYSMGYKQYQTYAPLNKPLQPPGVKVHCVYGLGVATSEQFSWKKGYFPDYLPYIKNGDGDGTVGERSATVCEKWTTESNNGNKVSSFSLDKVDHMAILKSPEAIEIIRKAVYDEI